MTTTTPAITLTVVGHDETLTLDDPRLVVAGYTARDQAAVRAHIDELAAIGVAPPASVPMYYSLPSELVTTDPTITVGGSRTSGEVEPIVVWSGGRRYLGIGSDHTDREIEVDSVADSKAAAPKPVGGSVVPLDEVVDRWDDIEVTCQVDGQPYQAGSLAAMLTPQDLIDGLAQHGGEPTGDAVMFCGTLPLITGEFVHGTAWEMELRLPDGRTLTLAYTVDVTG